MKLDPLPSEPWGADVVVWRKGDTGDPCGASIPWTVIWHSPAGWNFGYAGSGPADLALNILNVFVPPRKLQKHEGEETDFEREDMPVECFRGYCSQFAARHHQAFKEEFIVPMRSPGGTLTAALILFWIEQRRRERD